MFFGGAFAAFGNRLLQLKAVDLNACTDHHVVNGNPRVLTQQIGVGLGHFDIADHGAQYRLAGGVGLAGIEPLEAFFDIRRQQL